MEAIALGALIGAGVVVAWKHSRTSAKKAVGWAARQAGWLSGQVNTALEDARRIVRDQYQQGREENLATMTELPPPSTRPNANGVNGTNGTHPHP